MTKQTLTAILIFFIFPAAFVCSMEFGMDRTVKLRCEGYEQTYIGYINHYTICGRDDGTIIHRHIPNDE